jgi:hypothetical protein
MINGTSHPTPPLHNELVKPETVIQTSIQSAAAQIIHSYYQWSLAYGTVSYHSGMCASKDEHHLEIFKSGV